MSTGLRGRDFRLLWFGETTSALGSGVTAVALPLVALATLDAGVAAVGVLAAVAWLPWLVVGLPAGAWVDRLSPRRIMITCDAVALLAFASVPVAALAGVLTLAQLVVVAALEGVAKVFFATSYRALIPALVDDADLVAANARLQGAEQAAATGGPALGGLLAQVCGAANALWADAATFAVSLGCLLRMRPDEPRRVTPRRRLRSEIAEGVTTVVRDPLLRTFALTGALANLALMGCNVLELVFLVRSIGLSVGTAGLVLASGGAGGVVGAVLAPWLGRRFGTGRAVLGCVLAAPVAALAMPLAGGGAAVVLFVLGQVGLSAAVTAGNVIRAGFMQGYCPRELIGRVSTAQQVVNFGAIPLGALLGGVLGAHLGPRTALVTVLGAFAAVSGLLLFSPLRGMRDLPTRAAEVSDPAGRIVHRDRPRRRTSRRAGAGRPRSRAARGRRGRARAGLHPRRCGHGQDTRDHAPHRLRRALRRGPARSAARRHLHRSRRR